MSPNGILFMFFCTSTVKLCVLYKISSFDENKVITLLDQNNVAIIYSYLMENSTRVIIDTNGNLTMTTNLEKFNFLIIIIKEVENFRRFIKNFYRSPLWNSQAKYLVILTEDSPLETIFQISWKYFLINLTIIKQTMEVFTYFPLVNTSCDFIKIKELCHLQEGCETLFPVKLADNFHKCPIKVIPLIIPPFIIDLHSNQNPGYEIHILREASTKINFSISYLNHSYDSWGYKMENGSYTEMLSVVFQEEADILLGFLPLNQTHITDFDVTAGHIFECARFFVPTALPVQPWKNITRVFNELIWVLIALSIVTVSFAFWAIQTENGLMNSFFNTFRLFFTVFNKKPKLLLTRLVFLVWSIYSYLICSSYQSTLISFLTKPSFERQISTVEELVDSDLSYGGKEVVKSFFYEPNNPVFMKIYNNWKICSLALECTNRTAYQRDFAVLKNTRQILYLMPKYYTFPSGRRMLYGFKKPSGGYLQGILFRKGLPLFGNFQRLVVRLRESGILEKWDLNEMRNDGGDGLLVVLNMSHLCLAFVILIFGNGIALMVFMIETITVSSY